MKCSADPSGHEWCSRREIDIGTVETQTQHHQITAEKMLSNEQGMEINRLMSNVNWTFTNDAIQDAEHAGGKVPEKQHELLKECKEAAID